MDLHLDLEYILLNVTPLLSIHLHSNVVISHRGITKNYTFKDYLVAYPVAKMYVAETPIAKMAYQNID